MVDLRKKLRSGMIAVGQVKKWIVLTDCETKFYGFQNFCLISDGRFSIGSNYREDLKSDNHAYSIEALYKPTINCETYSMDFTEGELLWTREPKNLKQLIISRRFLK